jgi:hypothetical protein
MRSEPIALLTAMYASRGDRIVRDPELCNALLTDGCPECRKEIAILMNTIRCGAAQELLGSTAPYQSLRARLIQKVQDEQGLTPEAACWGVDTWREALRGGAPKAPTPERPAPPQPAPPVAPQPVRPVPVPAPQGARPSPLLNALIYAVGCFLVYWVMGLGLMLVVGMVFQTTSHSSELMMSIFAYLTQVGMFAFFTRVSGLVGTLAYFVFFPDHRDFSMRPRALGGGVAGAIAFFMMTVSTEIPNGVVVVAIVIGGLWGVALSKYRRVVG